MHLFKRLISALLALVLMISAIPVQVFATETQTPEATVDTDMSVEGTDSFGTLLTEAITEEQDNSILADLEAEYESGYTVTGLTISGSTATVTYGSMEEAMLVVALHSEDGMQLLTTASTTVTPEETEATVTFTESMPAFFLASAYLLDVYDFSPLCSAFETPMYTSDMQELLALTVEDCVEEYGEERLYNLDSSDETNFAVYSEGTIVIREENGSNNIVSADDGSLTYIFANADETVANLSEGNIVSYEYLDGELLFFKVSSAEVDGTSVTVQGADLELEEVFQLMKLEGGTTDSNVTASEEGMSPYLTYEGMDIGPATYSDSRGDSLAVERSLIYTFKEKKIGGKNDGIFTGEGKMAFTLQLGIKGTLDFYISTARHYMSLKVTPNVKLDFKLEGEVGVQGMALGNVDIYLCPGVYVHLKPRFTITFGGEIETFVAFKFDVGFAAEHGDGSLTLINLCTWPKAEFDFSIEGKVFLGIDLGPEICILSDKIASASMEGKIGVEFLGVPETNVFDPDAYKSGRYPAQRHDCTLCINGDIHLLAEVEAKAKFLNSDKLSVKKKIFSDQFKLGDFYWSVEHMEMDWGDCPHILYHVKVHTMDRDEKDKANIEVKLGNGDILGKTNSRGVLEGVYLEKGSKTFVAVIDEESVRYTENVYTYSTVTLTASEEYWARRERQKALMIMPDNVSAQSKYVSGETGDAKWTLYTNGTLEVSGSGEMKDYSAAKDTPWYKYRDKIRSIRVTDDVTHVGSYAFADLENLKKVIIDDNTTSIGNRAFQNCTKLEEVRLPVDISIECTYQSSVHPNYFGSFIGCNNVKKIHYTYGQTGKMSEKYGSHGSGYYNYGYMYSLEYYCRDALESVYFDDGITSISNYAFDNCVNLTDVVLPASITSIGAYAFRNCSNVKAIDLNEGLTSIGSYALYNCSSIPELYIPSTLTSIPDYCFYRCTGLSELEIPDSITTLGNYAFAYCSGVTNITLPVDITVAYTYQSSVHPNYFGSFIGCNNVKNIHYTYGQTGKMTEKFGGHGSGYYSYGYMYSLEWYCKDVLESVTFDEGIISVGNYAFYQCDNLTTVTTPSTLQTVGSYAFYQNYSLVKADLGNNVSAIGAYAFSGDSKLPVAKLTNNLTSLGAGAFQNCSSVTEIYIPSTLTAIPDYCFYGCSGLTELEIPDSITTLGNYAFAYCSGVTDITLPVDITVACVYQNNVHPNYFGSFIGCNNVKKIHYTYGQTGKMSEKYGSHGSGYYNYGYMYSLEYYCRDALESVYFDDGITSISNYAFDNCVNLTDVVLPASITSIGTYAFRNCSNVKAIDLNEGLTSIGSYALYNCSSITEIYIPSTLTAIPDYCFYGCSGLTELEIPDSITTLGNYAFAYCSGVTDITLPVDITVACVYQNNVHPNYFGSFIGCNSVKNIHYTYGQTGKMTEKFGSHGSGYYSYGYMYSLEWYCKDVLETVSFDEGITSVGNYAFYQCDNLTTVTTPSTLQTVGSYAFYQNYSLVKADLGNNVSAIGAYAFSGDSNLPVAKLTNNLTSLGAGAFQNCSSVTEIYIPSTLTAIPDYCFYGCSGLTELEIPDSITTLGNYAFAYCSGVTDITLPVDITVACVYQNNVHPNYFGSFIGCNNVKKIHYTYGQTGKMSEKSGTHGSGVYSYGYMYSLEYYCRDALESVYFDDGITSITAYAFDNCVNLTDVVLPASITSIGAYAFRNCSNVKAIDLNEGLTSIGSYALYNCSSITELYIPSTLTAIPDYCFYGCSGLTELEIPDSITTLGNYAFAYCSGVTDITLPVDITVACVYQNNVHPNYFGSFIGCNNVKNIHYTYGHTGIMTEKFRAHGSGYYSYGYMYSLEWYCQDVLETVTFDEGITQISPYSFYQCSELNQTIFYGSAPESIASNSFSGVTAEVLYPAEDDTWTEDIMQGYGGNLTWVPYIRDEYGNITTDPEPVEEEPEETIPEETVPEETIPEETVPEVTAPEVTVPEETAPEETEPAQTQPIETEPEETEPVETESNETEPVETYAEEVASSASAVTNDPVEEEPSFLEKIFDSVNLPSFLGIFDGVNDSSEENGVIIHQASFSGLVPGEEYVMFALRSLDVPNLLANDNILAIAQNTAGSGGSLSFRYILKEQVDEFKVFACGATNQNLKDAEITFPQVVSDGEARFVDPVVTYGGKVLTEYVDYVIIEGNVAGDPGEYKCYIRGICNYTGLVECTYQVLEKKPASIADTGRTLSLAGVIYINQYIKPEGFESVDIGKNGGMLIWNTPVSAENAVFGQEDVLVEGLLNAGNGEYAQQTPGIAARAYADNLYIRMYIQDNEGNYVYGPLVEYSVRDYCEGRLEKSSNEMLKRTCAELLHFGAAAQTYFKYNLEDLANKNIVSSYPQTAWDEDLLTALEDPNTQITGTGTVQDNGKTLSLTGALLVNFYFKLDASVGTPKTAEVLFWDGVKNTLTLDNVTYTKALIASDGEYGAQSDMFAAREFSKTIFACAHFVDADGNDHYSDVVAYSPEAYAAGRLEKSTNANMVALMKAMVTYGETARLYFA